MTYRGVYRDGVVVLNGDVDLRNGATVEVHPTRAAAAKSRSSKPARAKARSPVKAKSSKKDPLKYPLPGFGAWKHRTDIGDSAEYARELRRRASSRMNKA